LRGAVPLNDFSDINAVVSKAPWANIKISASCQNRER